MDVRPLYCAFGENRVLADVLSSELVACRTPRSDYPGKVNVTLECKGIRAASRITFEYIDIIRLSALNPPQGSMYGGSNVTVTGHGFSRGSDLSCRFGRRSPHWSLYLI